MKNCVSKLLLVLLYLLISLPFGMFVAAVAMQVLIKLFYLFTSGLNFDLGSIDFAKIFKGSVAGGVIGAIGCWYIYYQQSRK